MSIRAVSLQAIGVGKSFGSFQALKDVTLDVGRGEFLTLLGPSGSGKTTFLMIVAGFEQPTVGRLMSEGEDITLRSAEARSFGMVFQGYALFPHMTVAQNIAFPLQVRKTPRDLIARRVAEIIERVGLNGQEGKLPAKLSGGQQQRDGARARARLRAFRPPARRAFLGARQAPAQPDARRSEAAASGVRHDLHLRHPRSERGAISVLADRDLQPRRIASDRSAAGGLRASDEPLRRRVPRRDQPSAGRGRRPLPHRHGWAVRRRASRRSASESRQEERRSGGAAGAHVCRRPLS